MGQEAVCPICEAGFRHAAMVSNDVGVLVCKPCAKEHPAAKKRSDVVKDPLAKARSLTEEVVKDLIYEILEEANLKRVKCEKCDKMFFRRSPMQKYCPACKLKDSVSKKAKEDK